MDIPVDTEKEVTPMCIIKLYPNRPDRDAYLSVGGGIGPRSTAMTFANPNAARTFARRKKLPTFAIVDV